MRDFNSAFTSTAQLIGTVMEPSVQFVEKTTLSVQSSASSHHAIGGVVRLRSHTSIGPRRSINFAKPSEFDDAEDEDAGLRNEDDYKRSQVRATKAGVI